VENLANLGFCEVFSLKLLVFHKMAEKLQQKQPVTA